MDNASLEIRKILALTRGLEQGLQKAGAINVSNWQSFKALVVRAENATGEDLSDLRAFSPDLDDGYVSGQLLRPKLAQLVGFLEVLDGEGAVVEIGTLFNSIKDGELRTRCSDLLSAKSHFDRVINQATLVLEDRIRRKAGADKTLIGVKLVNEVIKGKPGESILVISDTPEEQEGVAHICRGIMLALRNETHHHLVEDFTREEAFHICGFIDRLLKLIDNAKVQVP